MSGVRIKVRADTSQARTEMNRLTTSVRGIESRVAGAASGLQKLLVFGAVAASVTKFTKSIVTASDAMVKFENRVALVVGRGKSLKTNMDELFQIAGRSGSRIDTVADTFGRIGLAVQEAGRSTEELLIVTEAINKSAQISGASAATAAASITQLSQGLGAGALRGEELNSVMEGLPSLARVIADGMEIPFGKLRELAKEGKLDAESVFDAILSKSIEIDEVFSNLNFTVGDLTNVLANEWGRMLANVDKVFGFSKKAKENIIALTTVFEYVGKNIERWALKAQIQFKEVELAVLITANNIDLALKQVFDIDLAAGRLVKSTSIALSKIRAFGAGVIKAFKDMFMDIFGNSWWWEMWDEGEDSITSARLDRALSTVTEKLQLFKVKVIDAFKEINNRAKPYINDLKEQLSFKEVSTPGGIERVPTKLAESWATVTESIGLAANSIKGFHRTLTTKRVSTPGGVELVDISYLEAASIQLDKFYSLVKSFELPQGMKDIRDAFGEAFRDNLLLAEATLNIFKEKLDEFREAIIVGISFDSDKVTAGLAAMSALFYRYGIKQTLGWGFTIFVALELADTAVFQERVEAVFRGVGKYIAGLFEPGGDIALEILHSVGGLMQAAIDGATTGLFGEGDHTLAQKIVGSVVSILAIAAGAIAVSSKVRAAFFAAGGSLGLQMSRSIGLSFSKNGSNHIGFAAKKIKASAGFKGIGTSMGNVLGAAMNAALVLSLAESFKSVEAEGEELELKNRGMNAGIDIASGAAAGFMVGGPWGAAIGALLGGIRAIWTDPGLLKDVQTWVEDLAADLYNKIVDGVVSAFTEAGKFVTEMIKGWGDSIAESWNKLFESAPKDSSVNAPDPGTDFTSFSKGLNSGSSNSEDLTGGSGDSKPDGSEGEDQLVEPLNRLVTSMDKLVGGSGDFALLGGSGIDLLAVNNPLPSAAVVSGTSDGRFAPKISETNVELARLRLRLQANELALGSNTEQLAGINEELDEEGNPVGGGRGSSNSTTEGAEQAAESFKGEFASALKRSIVEGDSKGFLYAVADAFSNKILDSFVDNLTEGLLDNLPTDKLFKGIGKLSKVLGDGIFSGFSDMFNGEGGLMEKMAGLFKGSGSGAGIFSFIKGIFGFDQGGIVPSTSTSQVGKDSVPALLKPGELVVAPNRINQFMGKHAGAGGNTVVNLNVTGDVSKQTRREIMAMIPQIASGVNATNKERGVY